MSPFLTKLTALNSDWDYQDPSCKSVLRSALASMPSLSFFSDRLREDQPSIGDVRRLFYLCRDQLKIIGHHSVILIRKNFWKMRSLGTTVQVFSNQMVGAEYAYFSSKGKVRCGHFFDGPITERWLNLQSMMQICTVSPTACTKIRRW